MVMLKMRNSLDYLIDSDSIFMHCLPIRRNIVADDAVVDGKHSIIYDQAENRLYTVKALLYYLLKQKG
jgi:ornithine carbamoyltransferase